MLPRLGHGARTSHQLLSLARRPWPCPRQLDHLFELRLSVPQSSRRSFASTPYRSARPSAEHRIDRYIQSALEDMDVRPPSAMPRPAVSMTPRTADASALSSLASARFAPGWHVVKANDRTILAPLAHARSVQRLAHYRTRAAQRPLWIDWIVLQAGCSPVVVSLAKRRMRLALRLALAARGVHKYGWRKEAVERAWAANRAARFGGGEKKNTEKGQGSRGGGVTPQQLEELRREAKVPVLTGTVWVTIRKPLELIETPFEKLRQMADRLVGGLLERHEEAGKSQGMSRQPKKTGRKVERASRGSRNEDLDAEFEDLGPSLTKDGFF
ncbi:hypothetical protein VDGD_20406 [Verticillium dahliae]|nr:hypothetical protein VDGD_20406 [Verticillium dahliae]